MNRATLIAGFIALLPLAGLFLSDAPFLVSFVLFSCLWILSLYDWFTYRLPNILTATFALCGMLYIYTAVPYEQIDHVIGGVVGLLFFPLLNILYKMVRGRDGIGMGDAKLLAGIGLWLGWAAIPAVLLIASVAGLIYALCLNLLKSETIASTRLPFGPFLSLGCWVSWLYFI